MPKPKSKSDPQSDPSPTTQVTLKGSPALLRVAWVVLFIWIFVLAALAFHVVGVW